MKGIVFYRKYIILNYKKNTAKNKNVKSKLVDIPKIIYIDLLIGLIPIAIYMVLKNHSWNHAFFTYRNILATNIALNIGIIKIYDLFIVKNDINT